MSKNDKKSKPEVEVVKNDMVKITKDVANDLRIGLEGFLKSPGASAPNSTFFKMRRLWKRLEAILAADTEQNEAWKKSVSDRIKDIYKKYADLNKDGELELKDNKPVFSKDGSEEACLADLRAFDTEVQLERSKVVLEYSKPIEVEVEWFSEADIPNELVNSAKTTMLDYFCK